MALLAAFTSDLHRSTIQVQFADEQLRGLMRARTGVVQKQQQRVISTSLIGCSVRGAKKSVHMRLFQVRQQSLAGFFERDGTNLATPSDMFWAVLSDKPGQGMNRSQALVAGWNGTSSGLFQVRQEEAHHICRQ